MHAFENGRGFKSFKKHLIVAPEGTAWAAFSVCSASSVLMERRRPNSEARAALRTLAMEIKLLYLHWKMDLVSSLRILFHGWKLDQKSFFSPLFFP